MIELALRDGDPAFDTTIGSRIQAMPCFRTPTEIEIDASYEAYRSGDTAALCARWCEVADPIRATLPAPARWVYPRLGRMPSSINAATFLIMVRAALGAGVRFRAGLSAPVRHALEHDFPWLEQRHEHIPDGYTPIVAFPEVFAAFVDAPDLNDARARWQLCCLLNEVQQSWYSRSAATLFGVPELARHADRERALAVNYAAHWSPACRRELWRQTLWVLDALNAALFEWVTSGHTASLVIAGTCAVWRKPDEWRAFVRGMDTEQVLVPPPPQPASRMTL